jgi:gliding motility-associated-like protein
MKRNSLLILLLLTSFSLKAQYADLGEGTLKGDIWWFDWTSFTLADGASKTFTTTDGLSIKITFSKVSGPIPRPSVMNTWSGAVLHFLYDFSNPAIQPALFAENQLQSSVFTMQVDATRNGVATPFTFCAVDAEASVVDLEATTFITTGGNWRTLQFYRNSTKITNPLTGCGTQKIVITDTQHSNAANSFIPIGQSPLMATDAPSTGTVSVEVHMDRVVNGGMAVAFGILTPVDRGDLPASYGYAAHKISYAESNSCNYDVPFPAVTQNPNLKLGTVLPDSDPFNDVDDNLTGVDEDAITTFPDYDRSGTYTINVPLTNNTGAAVYLSGWFDLNRNQLFDANEMATATVPDNATTATLTWTGIPNKPVQGNTKLFGFRFRLSTKAVTTASSIADDGEVEDYLTVLRWICDPLTTNISSKTVCVGIPVQLNATGNYPTYTWSPDASLSAVNIANPVATPTTNNTYTVTATDGDCSQTASIIISIDPLPSITKSADVITCIGTPTQLSAAADIPSSYSWLPATGLDDATSSDPSANPTATTRYVVTATTAGGCSNKDSILVNIHHPDASIVDPPSGICKGESTVLRATGGNTYEWQDADNTTLGNTDQLTITPASNTTYKVIVTDDICQIIQTLDIPVIVNLPPTTTVKYANLIDCTHPETKLTASGGVQYLWEAAAGIKDLTIADPVVRPTTPTTYHVQITDANGCSNVDSVAIAMDLNTALSNFPMASAFTPNGDGKNDCFGFKYWGAMTVDFSIFNRLGELIFHSTTLDTCWDGTYKGQPQPIGTYVYIIRAKTLCGDGERKGTVVLLR